jgi:hypothetical protein
MATTKTDGFPVRFLCGCKVTIKGREHVKLSDDVLYDESGLLICATHGQRRYGWRSTPLHRMDGWHPKDIEAYMVFGEFV